MATDPEENISIALLVAALLAAFVASVVTWGYPALIVGALIAVALTFVVIPTLTADGLFPRQNADHRTARHATTRRESRRSRRPLPAGSLRKVPILRR